LKPKAIYAGSFDPITFGHLDIIRRAARDFDLTVLVASNPQKKYLLTLEERQSLVEYSVNPNVTGGWTARVASLVGDRLTADWAFETGNHVIIRGIRSFADYDMESMLRDVNISQHNGIETYFLKSDQRLTHVSSTAVKELYKHAGFIHEYVPLWVKYKMEQKAKALIVGVTGNIASGKNWYCNKLTGYTKAVHHLDMDKLAHFILFDSPVEVHSEVRRRIRSEFNLPLRDGFATPEVVLTQEDRKVLGSTVFADPDKREKLNAIMYQPLLTALRQAVHGKEGVILVNAALLAEFKLLHICNNNVVLVTTDEKTRRERMLARGYTRKQVMDRLSSQYTDERKKYHIEEAIKRDHFGKLMVYDNQKSDASEPDIHDLFTNLYTIFNLK
jgi:pantetheine-phosphate adenylyltransferase